jgi:hypothetical protein
MHPETRAASRAGETPSLLVGTSDDTCRLCNLDDRELRGGGLEAKVLQTTGYGASISCPQCNRATKRDNEFSPSNVNCHATQMPMQWRERYHALIVRSVANSAYPPRLSVIADVPVRQPSAMRGLLRCNKIARLFIISVQVLTNNSTEYSSIRSTFIQ